jgi:hypothetical protein
MPMMGKKKVALKGEKVSRLHGREGMRHTKLAQKKKAPHRNAEAEQQAQPLALQRRKQGKKAVVHELIAMLLKEKKTRYLKESRGAGAANTSRLIAELHAEIGEYLQSATAFVAAAQEALGAHNLEEEEKLERVREYFAKAAANYERAGKPHKAEWAKSQAESAGAGKREAA